MSFLTKLATIFSGVREPPNNANVVPAFAAAPVIASPPDRGYDREFRRPGDEAHVIRINQKPPKGLPKKVADFVAVVGTTQPVVAENVAAFVGGKERQVRLVREPDNPVDPNAIAVYGAWTSEGGDRSGRLGYLPAAVAAGLVEQERIGATLVTMYREHAEKSAGIRISVWRPRRKRGQSPGR